MAKSSTGPANRIGTSRKAIKFAFDIDNNIVPEKVGDIDTNYDAKILAGLNNIKRGEFYFHEKFFHSIGIRDFDVMYDAKRNPKFKKYMSMVRKSYNNNYIVVWCNPKDAKALYNKKVANV